MIRTPNPTRLWQSVGILFIPLLVACGAEGTAGDECTSEADCGDGLHCHMDQGVGLCHSDEEHDHDEEDEEDEE